MLRGIDAADVPALVPYARRGVMREWEAELPLASGTVTTRTLGMTEAKKVTADFRF